MYYIIIHFLTSRMFLKLILLKRLPSFDEMNVYLQCVRFKCWMA